MEVKRGIIMKIFLVIILIILLIIEQRKIYRDKSFKELYFEMDVENTGVFEGDKVKLTQKLTNKKLLPVLWVKVQFLVSKNLVFEEVKEKIVDPTYYKKDIYSLLPYERITKKFIIIASKRGYYSFININLTCSDLFLKNKYIKNIYDNKFLYVYPKLISSKRFKAKFEKITGEIVTRRNVIEDHFQLRGIRDYCSYDSIKAVNWNATARTGELKVNQYDFTASEEVLILLNFDKYNKWDSEQLFEGIISLGASFVNEYLNMGIFIELISNGMDGITGEEINVGSISGVGCASIFYEKLARIDVSKKTRNFKEIVAESVARGIKKPLWIVVSHYLGQDLRNEITLARGLGFNIQWIVPKFENEKLDITGTKDITLWEVKSIEG